MAAAHQYPIVSVSQLLEATWQALKSPGDLCWKKYDPLLVEALASAIGPAFDAVRQRGLQIADIDEALVFAGRDLITNEITSFFVCASNGQCVFENCCRSASIVSNNVLSDTIVVTDIPAHLLSVERYAIAAPATGTWRDVDVQNLCQAHPNAMLLLDLNGLSNASLVAINRYSNLQVVPLCGRDVEEGDKCDVLRH